MPVMILLYTKVFFSSSENIHLQSSCRMESNGIRIWRYSAGKVILKLNQILYDFA
jgi:hypothetical protein